MNHITFNELPEAVTQLYNKLSSIERMLIQRDREQDGLNNDSLLTVSQAASLLSLAAPTIYSLVQKAEIPVSKRGKRLYFSKSELIEWIKKGRRKTTEETLIEAEDLFISKRKGVKHA